jgi:hypothetical protein
MTGNRIGPHERFESTGRVGQEGAAGEGSEYGTFPLLPTGDVADLGLALLAGRLLLYPQVSEGTVVVRRMGGGAVGEVAAPLPRGVLDALDQAACSLGVSRLWLRGGTDRVGAPRELWATLALVAWAPVGSASRRHGAPGPVELAGVEEWVWAARRQGASRWHQVRLDPEVDHYGYLVREAMAHAKHPGRWSQPLPGGYCSCAAGELGVPCAHLVLVVRALHDLLRPSPR